MADEAETSNKPHRAPHSGRKALKKKAKSQNADAQKLKGKNPKAFTFKSAVRAGRSIRRAADIVEKKTRIPETDRTPLEPPPLAVVIVGPPKVGKSTLLRCLVKNYTRQSLHEINGPVTVVAGKKRRITLMECNNDINSMIDVSKVADLVLLLIDASFGFEMEVFEFLHICQAHGMPKIIGVLTHLDLIRSAKRLKKVKKELKQRFWVEIYQGAKLFHLSGMVNSQYTKNDVKNLARFMSVVRYHPPAFRTLHPYLIMDRMEDLTEPEKIHTNPKCDRTVSCYGYVRGSNFQPRSGVHMPGVGDFRVSDIAKLPDPCPLPENEKKRSLSDKEKLIYAPFSGVGGIMLDKDAVYIELGGSHSHFPEKENAGANVLPSTDLLQLNLDQKISESRLALFQHSKSLSSSELQLDSERESGGEHSTDLEQSSRSEDSSGQDIEDTLLSKKKRKQYEETPAATSSRKLPISSATENAAALFRSRLSEVPVNWQDLVYTKSMMEERQTNGEGEDDEEIGGLFRINKLSSIDLPSTSKTCDQTDCTSYSPVKPCHELQWTEIELDAIKDSFVTGTWGADEDAKTLLKSVDDGDGDFEDLENTKSSSDRPRDVEEVELEKLAEEEEAKSENDEREQARLEKKRKLKQSFDSEYDGTSKFYQDLKETLNQQSEINKTAFASMSDDVRVQFEGYRPGLYVRIKLENVPCELVDNFDPTYPYLMCGLLPGEENVGYVQVRIKKHRWHNRILKSYDPLIISLGWRRFQSLMVYMTQDHNGRNRLLKYTPQHMHCCALFWGPLTPQNTGFIAVQSVASVSKEFRLAANGVVLNMDKSLKVVKKLKLVGTPFKVYTKSAFIQGMFSSTLEVAKFEGAALRTVSGLRGQIKKALRSPPGAFRAGFEDKILLKDIVFLRAWYPVEIPKFCTTVTNLLYSGEKKSGWQGVRTVGQMRFELGLKPAFKEDSIYKPIERKPRVPAPLVIPKHLERNLPFAFRPKYPEPAEKPVVPKIIKKHTAVVLEPHESKVVELIKMLKAIHEDNEQNSKKLMQEKMERHKKEMAKLEAVRSRRQKLVKKRICRVLSKLEKRRQRSHMK